MGLGAPAKGPKDPEILFKISQMGPKNTDIMGSIYIDFQNRNPYDWALSRGPETRYYRALAPLYLDFKFFLLGQE